MKTVKSYISRFPASTQRLLKGLRSTIKKAAPKAQEKIAWGMPSFAQDGYLVVYAAFKQHIGFFPGPTGITAFKKQLTKYKTSKGTIRLPLDEKIPTALITRIVKFRVKENAAKARLRGAKKRSRKRR